MGDGNERDRRGPGRFLGGLTLALALAGGPELGAAPRPVAGGAPLHDDDMLLLALRMEPVSLSDGMPAYAAGGGTLLPLGQLCEALDLAVQVDPDRGTAEGFIIDPARTFRLDAMAGTFTLAGVTRTLERNQAYRGDGDLYLDTRALAQFLPLEFKVDPRAAMVTVRPREQLPIQARWLRETSGSRLGAAPEPKALPPIRDPYRLVELPAVDVYLALAGRSHQAGARDGSALGSVLAAGDFLGLSGSGFAQVQDQGGVTDAHLALGRRDPRGTLLGPLRATEFAFGQVLYPGLNLASTAASGTGAVVSNQPLDQSGGYDRHSFQGDLPPGWQVELYRNQGLVGFQAAKADGHYQFLDVPLQFGPNEFRLVFYGPQGQRREEVLRLDVSQNQTPPGRLLYRMAQVKPDAAPDQRRRTQVQASYGLSERLTLFGGATRLTFGQQSRSYTQAGLVGFWKPLSGSLTRAWEAGGASITELALRTRLGAASLVGKATLFGPGYQSEAFQFGYGAIRRRTELQASTPLPGPRRPWFNLDLTAVRDDLLQGGRADTWQAGLSTSRGRNFFSNQVRWGVVKGIDAPAPPASGTFLASRVFSGFSLRGQAAYTLDRPARLTSLALNGDLTRFVPYTFQAGLSHLTEGRDSTATLAMVKGQGRLSLGASLAYSTQSRWTVALNLRFGMARPPRGHQTVFQAQGEAGFGAVAVDAFLDGNANGTRDPGEKPLPGLGFLVNGSRHPTTTDDDGRAFLDGLPIDSLATVAVRPETIDDPLMKSAVPGWAVLPRPGHAARLEVPVVVFGEVSGVAYRRQGVARRVLPGLRLELRDGQGQVVRSARTAFDGYFYFTDLRPGTYQLEVPAAAAARMGAPPPAPQVLRLAPEGTMLDNLRVTVEEPDVHESVQP